MPATSIVQTIARDARRGGVSLSARIATETLHAMLFIAGFLVATRIMNFGVTGLRGDPFTFVAVGVLIYQVHVKAMSGAMRTGKPGDRSMILIGPISDLVVQVSAATIIMTGHRMVYPTQGAAALDAVVVPYIAAWASGVGIGFSISAARPVIGGLAPIASTSYSRASILASGQFFAASLMPLQVVSWFDWNPLFHLIDQARAGVFESYSARHTVLLAPSATCVIILALGSILVLRPKRHPEPEF